MAPPTSYAMTAGPAGTRPVAVSGIPAITKLRDRDRFTEPWLGNYRLEWGPAPTHQDRRAHLGPHDQTEWSP